MLITLRCCIFGPETAHLPVWRRGNPVGAAQWRPREPPLRARRGESLDEVRHGLDAGEAGLRDLTAQESADFREQGFVIIEGLLSARSAAALRSEVDDWVGSGGRNRSIAACVDPARFGAPETLELDLPGHAALACHPTLMTILRGLLGPGFGFHHMHSDRQEPGLPGKAWHHDYEQRPQRDRRYAMVHALHYLNGLDESASSLVVLPGSHRRVAEKTALASLGTAEQPGEVEISALRPGSTVLLHSALFHARRARRSAATRPRYMVDASYCQAGVRWPQVKPYWREMLRRGRRIGPEVNPNREMFAAHHFSEYTPPSRTSGAAS